ncbi:hypothetical protein KC614_01405 [candidate division WWE3 bacterium]|uniref:Tyrosinase copper-binding domain-containing protein n=1 Tax=candidate division WWE3 bacterium TaxID=2053526 RepID=A0A955LJX0_UNCKA|nr:hypothetical protein [candidate division WWE3 bacterium]
MRAALKVGFVATAFLLVSGRVLADSTPPVTTSTLDGVAGQNGWYRSNIDVTLDITDSESGVGETTYWVDSESPTTIQFTSATLSPFQNNSFEKGHGSSIDNWYGGQPGFVLYYRSNLFSYDGNRSAAMAYLSVDPTFYYWHNEPDAVMLPDGETVVISAWARTIMFSGDTAYFEVWGQDASGNNDTLIATSNVVDGFNWTWQNVQATFTVPAGLNYIYVKLGGVGTPAAIIYWDKVEILPAGGNAEQVEFNYATEGQHILHYYSEDNDGNVESEKTADLKIDTVIPNPWQNFIATDGGCNHCYDAQVEVEDITSGIDVSTAEYRFYTEHNLQYWSDWNSVSEVNKVSNNQPAGDGEQAFVYLIPPELNFGDSAHPPWRVQYRVCDLAGNCSTSPAYDIVTPWLATSDGGVFIDGDIVVPTSPIGEEFAHADMFASNNYISATSETGWADADYDSNNSDLASISDFVPEYDNLKSSATVLGGILPGASGVYIVHGDLDMSASIVKNSYTNASGAFVFIVEGDLTLSTELDVVDTNYSVFLVEGDVLVTDKNAETISGFFIAEGAFDSDTTGDSRKSLTIKGSVLALEGYITNRDLGTSGTYNNSNTPAEYFQWRPGFLVNDALNFMLNGRENEYIWNEIGNP